MPSPLEAPADIESVLSADLQTRVPDTVRLALRLQPGDRLRYRLDADGRVSMENASRPAATSAIGPSPLLGLLAGLMSGESAAKAGAPSALDPTLMRSLQGLIGRSAKPGDKLD